MKDLVPFGGDNLISILTAISLLLPIGAILVRRSMWRWSLAALVVYYFQFFLFSFFPENYVSTGDQPIQLIQFSHVLIDLPLVLLFMHFFAEDGRTRSRIRRSLMGWVAWGIILIATMGLTQRITPYLMGPGILLAVARISGETAPLLFTALNNQFFSVDMGQPMPSLPVVIFQFALSPYKDWQELAWTGALIITFAVLALSIIARALASSSKQS